MTMRSLAFALCLACGGVVAEPPPVPDPASNPGPPPPHDYQVGFALSYEVDVWHSSTGTVTHPGVYEGSPAFTRDGTMFVAMDPSSNDPTNPPILDFVTGDGAVQHAVPFLPHAFGVRGDGRRLTFVDVNGALRTWDVDGTLGPAIATKVEGRASYAPDDKTLVFMRGGQVVTMQDDGTNEEVLVQSDASEPSFSWDGTKVVYAAGRKSVDVIDRATHETRTLFTSTDGLLVWTPALTPDGAYVVFVVGYSHFSVLREEIATGTIDALVKNLDQFTYASGPGFELSVAPDVTSK